MEDLRVGVVQGLKKINQQRSMQSSQMRDTTNLDSSLARAISNYLSGSGELPPYEYVEGLSDCLGMISVGYRVSVEDHMEKIRIEDIEDNNVKRVDIITSDTYIAYKIIDDKYTEVNVKEEQKFDKDKIAGLMEYIRKYKTYKSGETNPKLK